MLRTLLLVALVNIAPTLAAQTNARTEGSKKTIGYRRVCANGDAQTYYFANSYQPAEIWKKGTIIQALSFSDDRQWILAIRDFDGKQAWVPRSKICDIDTARVICKADKTGLFHSPTPQAYAHRTIARGTKVQLVQRPVNGLAQISYEEGKFWVWTDYLCFDDPNVRRETNQPNTNSPFCQYSWEERPGTTDYTTIDRYSGRAYENPDRREEETLLGSGIQKQRDLCDKASALKHCFDQAILDNQESYAQNFRRWASSHNIDPVLALIAKTEQETKLGSIPDTCSNQTCNGIGLSQIISAYTPDGSLLRTDDPRWSGITFNILTNLTYSVRVISAKIPKANSLWELAYYYNGAAAAKTYATNVVSYYEQLQRCSL